MKTLLIVLVLCATSVLGELSADRLAKLRAYKESCIAETGVDPVLVENAKKGQFAKDDEKFACFLACLLKKIGIMDPDGNLQEEVARQKLPEGTPKDVGEKLINKCKQLVTSNVCETGAKVVACIASEQSLNIF